MTVIPPVDVQSVVVEVTPDAQCGATFTYNGEPQLIIDNRLGGILMIELVLEIESGRFASDPFLWLSAPLDLGGEPIPVPVGFSTGCLAAKVATIVDLNDQVGTQIFHFLVTVVLDGQVYTSPDPTIINHPG